MRSQSRQRRFERRVDRAKTHDRECDVCGRLLVQTDLGAQAMNWNDPAHMERPAWFVVVCGRCCEDDFAASLNELHRRRWERTHRVQPVVNWLLR